MTGIEIAQFRAGESNYNYLLYTPVSKVAVAVDPLDAKLVYRQAQNLPRKIGFIISTHGHWDHIAGNEELSRLTGAPIAAFAGEKIPGVTRNLRDGEIFELEDISLKILFTPGHTLGHICLLADGLFLMTGDTLFLGGCGNCKFGGDVAALFETLNKIARLPDALKIYCGHEYALKNLEFGLAHEPENAAIAKARGKVKQALAGGRPYVSTLGEEKEHNVFLRGATGAPFPKLGGDAKTVFFKLRALKDSF